MSIRIAVDLTPMPPDGHMGGAKTLTLSLLQALSERYGHAQFILLTSDLNYASLAAFERQNVHRQCVKTTTKGEHGRPRLGLRAGLHLMLASILPPRAISRLKREYYLRKPAGGILLENQADLLFCPFTAPLYFHPHIPAVSVVHDLQWDVYPEYFTRKELLYFREHFWDACHLAAHLVTISDFVCSAVLKKASFSPDRISTIYNLVGRVATPPGDAQEQTVLQRYALTRHHFLIYPANFWPHKNHAGLLKAFKRHLQNKPNSSLKLVCCGTDTGGQQHALKLAADCGIEERVVFPGYIPDSDLAALMNNALALIYPSLYEGFGMPLLEAMEMGKPVLCSNAASLPEVAGDAALYFDPTSTSQMAAAIGRIEQEDSLWARLSLAGRRRAERFGGAEAMAESYYNLFIKVIEAYKRNY